MLNLNKDLDYIKRHYNLEATNYDVQYRSILNVGEDKVVMTMLRKYLKNGSLLDLGSGTGLSWNISHTTK